MAASFGPAAMVDGAAGVSSPQDPSGLHLEAAEICLIYRHARQAGIRRNFEQYLVRRLAPILLLASAGRSDAAQTNERGSDDIHQGALPRGAGRGRAGGGSRGR